MKKTINLALQGGGSHGAFTWGVLDTLLADGRIAVEGVSGTSAGAVNAVALASGHGAAEAAGRDAHAGARQALARLWGEIGHWGALGSLQARLGRTLWGGLGAEFAHTNPWLQAVRDYWSPYQTNPMDLNPLRDLLQRQIDFGAIARPGGPKVFVSATHVTTGKAVIFSGSQLSVHSVMASACLPMLFRAVEIDGQAYWDGGYSVNPALTPLITTCDSADILVVQINPLRRERQPRTAAEIAGRVNELTFNASLLTQMRNIDLINRLLAEGQLAPGLCKPVRLHRIDGGAEMLHYTAASKTQADPVLIRELFEIGQQAAKRWLDQHFEALGRHGTVDVRRDYLDDTSLSWPEAPAGEPRPSPGFRPWLARLFRRLRPPR
ncbi:patatin-like phospholipase family protein [Ramlibacter tataouinensis]|uniref:patatin-like phospholipase family protein n=1 Tax=Ramlibacter tataouinensis TaxID=94132 RepID=UPI001D05C128|nr:patatin-like phospholipase family protein [Ramlibacter tataouinensis]